MDDSAAAVDEAAMDPSMADATMDVAMMEDVPEMADEAPAAPSVALSGSAKMGVKRVDNNMATDPDADNLKTVVEYEVVFSSSGVTDGGLMFGASISIDEEGKGAGTANGVNQASAYIGASNGSWKLTFGDNDPGIDLVGNIGLADADAISGGSTWMITPVTYELLAATVTASSTNVIRPLKLPGKSSALNVRLDDPSTTATDEGAVAREAAVGFLTDQAAHIEPDGTADLDDVFTAGVFLDSAGVETAAVSGGMPVSTLTGTLPGRTDARLDGKFGSFTFALTAGESGENAWSLGTKFDAGAISVGLGIDSNDVLAANVTGTFAGNTIGGTYVRQSGDDYNRYAVGGDEDQPTVYARAASANAWNAMGVKFARDLSEGTNIVLAYSKKDDKRKGYDIPEDSNKIELDFTYNLGGGAKFYAGIERLSEDSGIRRTDGDYDDMVKQTTKTTTLETGITMSF